VTWHDLIKQVKHNFRLHMAASSEALFARDSMRLFLAEDGGDVTRQTVRRVHPIQLLHRARETHAVITYSTFNTTLLHSWIERLARTTSSGQAMFIHVSQYHDRLGVGVPLRSVQPKRCYGFSHLAPQNFTIFPSRFCMQWQYPRAFVSAAVLSLFLNSSSVPLGAERCDCSLARPAGVWMSSSFGFLVTMTRFGSARTASA